MDTSKIQEAHPIGACLDIPHRSLSSLVQKHNGKLDSVSKNDLQAVTLQLAAALLGHPVSRLLPSTSWRENFRSDIRQFIYAASYPHFDFDRVKPLLGAVLARKSDRELWDQVHEVVAESICDTPIQSTSSSQQDSEQTHDDFDPRLLQEINGCIYRDTVGFYEKYFEGKEWSAESDKIAERVDPQVIEGRWTSYPQLLSQYTFLAWYRGFRAEYLQGGRNTFSSSPNRRLAGYTCKRKPDIFLVSSSSPPEYDRRYSWADVLVIGELKQSEKQGHLRDELLSLCSNAREVFTSQPTRRFLHGFFIRGSVMELWLFDRSGLYSCKTFDIHQDPRRFIKIIAGYSQMSDQELGVNTYIKEDGIGRYITCKEAEKEEERLYLEEKPISYQRAIISRGITCYRVKRQGSERWEYVVKFAWRSDQRRAEAKFLKLAKERKVWGVAKLFSYQDFDSIADIRRGLRFGKPQAFKSADSECSSPSLASREGSPAPPAKGFESGSRKNSATKSLLDVDNDTLTTNSLITPETRHSESFKNRIFSFLVISPPGRAIHKFTSTNELLQASRDVVKAHRSLYLEGGILHRDISEDNIIITDAEDEADPRGMLIDLHLAKEVNDSPSEVKQQDGTIEFMAIEVLRGRPHTYRHGLESFFYVFLWVIITHRPFGSHLPFDSRLRSWHTGGYITRGYLSDIRQGQMMSFECITDEFPEHLESLKGVAEEIHAILFSYRDEYLQLGTDNEPDKLYQPIINAFERAIARLSAS